MRPIHFKSCSNATIATDCTNEWFGKGTPVGSRIFTFPYHPDRFCGPASLLHNGSREWHSDRQIKHRANFIVSNTICHTLCLVVWLGRSVPERNKYRDLALHVGGVHSRGSVKYGQESCRTWTQELMRWRRSAVIIKVNPIPCKKVCLAPTKLQLSDSNNLKICSLHQRKRSTFIYSTNNDV